ncbi:Aspartyl/asparaginyl beta-hydroxylase [Collichthys lucidus]|uniref:Aspartyl/asparaginyl beta-hydroxylase n=1 Tax=Collichthys lucidus TaxID=240159 RepID=A0A4V6AS87_COLLU|nr:Aspartyl/asparaginyl beta-hydroxylase [Collichthys lucidus]
MQRSRHYGTSYSSSVPVEEVHAEKEEDPVFQETGGVDEEEIQLSKEEVQPVVEETEGKTSPPPVESKNGKRTERGGGDAGGEGSKYSMFTWFVVLALLGVWSSVAVVYFEIVDYDSVIARAKEFRMNFSDVLQGKLTAYDTDGDGDFDVEDAKVLLGKSALISLCSLSKDGGGSANAESLEEVLNILAEEGSDWIYGFFTFLYDVVSSPVERGKEEEDEGKEAAAAEMQEEGGASSSDDGEVNGVILDLQNQ